tara:strand:+ start:98 stop:508 length:411 start_codon:yes stop_codon:yes gene_type:complete
MKNNLIYFSFTALIIAGVGFTSVWKKNSDSIIVEENLTIPIEAELTSIIDNAIESIPISLEDQSDDAITYKNNHPVLSYLSGFSEAFMKAREMEFENFWFNGDLYHTKLKEDLNIEEGNHISSDMPEKQTVISENP